MNLIESNKFQVTKKTKTNIELVFIEKEICKEKIKNFQRESKIIINKDLSIVKIVECKKHIGYAILGKKEFITYNNYKICFSSRNFLETNNKAVPSFSPIFTGKQIAIFSALNRANVIILKTNINISLFEKGIIF